MTRDPDHAESGLDEALLAAARALRRRYGVGLGEAGSLDLSPHDARALRVVGRHGPVRLGVVAEHLRIAPRSATDVIDRLESRGLVAREADPADRRAMLVRLTDAGVAAVRDVERHRRGAAGEFFAPLSPAERHTLGDLLGRLGH